ncbi:hypothetical protein QEN19_001933 [Hanseniaspora menglaensis]
MSKPLQTSLEHHILYYCELKKDDSLPVVSFFNELGKNSIDKERTNYGSIERSLNQNSILNIIDSKIDFSKLNKTKSNIIMLTTIIPDYIIYVKNSVVDENYFLEVCITYKDIPKSLPLAILNDNKKRDNVEATNDSIALYITDYEALFNKQIQTTLNSTANIENELSNIVEIMNDNISQVLLRDDRLDQLHQKTLKLNDKGLKFKKTTLKMERRELWKNRKWLIIAVVSAFCLVLISISLYLIFSNNTASI